MRLQGSQIAPSLAVLERLGIAVFKRRVALRADVIADIILGGGALSHKQSLVSMCPAARTGSPCPGHHRPLPRRPTKDSDSGRLPRSIFNPRDRPKSMGRNSSRGISQKLKSASAARVQAVVSRIPDSARRGHATMQIFVKTVRLGAGISCADRASPRALFAVGAPPRVPHPALHPVCCASIEVRRKPLTPARWCTPAQTVDR